MIDLIATDTMFPEYRYGMDTDEYLRENNNYLFLLREDLNYALHNLGIANFNSRQLETLSGRITEPVYSRIEDAEGHIASLSYDYGLIEARVSDNEQSISDIRIDAQGIHTQVSEIQGDISDISGDVSGLTTRVSSVEQTASGISATVAEIQDDVSDLSGDLTSTTARVAQVEITAGSISSTVQELSTTVSGLSGSVTSLTSRVSTVEQTASGISATVQEIQGDYISATSAKQTSSAFSLTVKNGSGSNAAVLDKNGLSVYGGALSLYSGGTTSSNRVLYADNLGNLYIKGNITVKSLTLDSGATIDSTFVNNMKSSLTNAGMAQTSQIPTNLNQLTNGPGYQTSAQVGSLIAGTVTAAYVNALGISVNAANITGTLSAGKINLTGYEGTIGATDSQISLGYSSISLSCANGVKIGTSSGIVLLSVGTKRVSFPSDGCIVPGDAGHAEQTGWEAQQIGYSNRRWNAGYFNNVYGQTPEAGKSDRNAKNTISYDIDKYDAFFDALMPASFKYNDGTSDRTHIGLIAQQVLDGLIVAGLTSQDFAGYVQDETDGQLYLRYAEFIPLCIRQIQLLKARVAALEGA